MDESSPPKGCYFALAGGVIAVLVFLGWFVSAFVFNLVEPCNPNNSDPAAYCFKSEDLRVSMLIALALGVVVAFALPVLLAGFARMPRMDDLDDPDFRD